MAKYWVSLTKYAGVEVETDTAKRAKEIALDMDESLYEIPQGSDGDWEVWNVENVDDIDW